MSSGRVKLSPLGKGIAYVVFRDGEKGLKRESIEDRFGKERAEIGLQEVMSLEHPLLVYDKNRNEYKPSKHLKENFKLLNNLA